MEKLYHTEQITLNDCMSIFRVIFVIYFPLITHVIAKAAIFRPKQSFLAKRDCSLALRQTQCGASIRQQTRTPSQ